MVSDGWFRESSDRDMKLLERQIGAGEATLETHLQPQTTTSAQDDRLGVEQEDRHGQVDGSYATVSLSVS